MFVIRFECIVREEVMTLAEQTFLVKVLRTNIEDISYCNHSSA